MLRSLALDRLGVFWGRRHGACACRAFGRSSLFRSVRKIQGADHLLDLMEAHLASLPAAPSQIRPSQIRGLANVGGRLGRHGSGVESLESFNGLLKRCILQAFETWLFQQQNKGKPPFTSYNVQVYNVRIPVATLWFGVYPSFSLAVGNGWVSGHFP